MLRDLAPRLAFAALLVAAASVAYSFGTGVWVVYLAVIVGIVAVAPAYDRWDRRHFPEP